MTANRRLWDKGRGGAALKGHRSCADLFEELSLVADGETEEARCRIALDHVADCEPCRRYLESLKATRDALAASAAVPLFDEAEMARLLEACRRSLQRKSPEFFPGTPAR